MLREIVKVKLISFESRRYIYFAQLSLFSDRRVIKVRNVS